MVITASPTATGPAPRGPARDGRIGPAGHAGPTSVSAPPAPIGAPPVTPVAVSSLVIDILAAPTMRNARVLGAVPRCLYLLVPAATDGATDGAGRRGARDVVVPVVTGDGLALPHAVRLPTAAGRHGGHGGRLDHGGDRRHGGWGVVAGDTVRVGDGRIDLPDTTLLAARTWRPARVVRVDDERDGTHRASDGAELVVGAAAGDARSLLARPDRPAALVAAARRLARCVFAGPDPAGVDELEAALLPLVGWGPGSTPSGDDVVAATALVAWALGVPASGDVAGPGTPAPLASAWARLADRTSTLSASLVQAALAGYAVPELVTLVDALVARPPAPDRHVAGLVARVAAFGHTSGGDLLLGLAQSLAAVSRRAPGAADSPHDDLHVTDERTAR
ncbi:oxamate carbamoyltransferase subunit AllH family protein [Agilicoccus flavus]|uniref:oxamate carbamoyltransferase subunit AllH family protein n=1 Tax=Agilicoccus flavus TaxID=2775968 RepID=UPI001CF71651|nr:DUF2877 domain-containing protein [Agilicoccus flavus]